MSIYHEKMTQMKVSSLGGINPSDASLAAVKSEIGLDLPPNYIEILCDFGCWYTPLGYTYFRYRQPYPRGDRGMLNVFFGVLPGDPYDLVENYRSYKYRVPWNLIPIANDPGGNLLCLSLAGSNQAYIYFWDHETEAMAMSLMEPREATYSNLYLVAESLDAFITSLEFVQDVDDLLGAEQVRSE